MVKTFIEAMRIVTSRDRSIQAWKDAQVPGEWPSTIRPRSMIVRPLSDRGVSRYYYGVRDGHLTKPINGVTTWASVPIECYMEEWELGYGSPGNGEFIPLVDSDLSEEERGAPPVVFSVYWYSIKFAHWPGSVSVTATTTESAEKSVRQHLLEGGHSPENYVLTLHLIQPVEDGTILDSEEGE